LKISESDAIARYISNGDKLNAYNKNGTVFLKAKISRRPRKVIFFIPPWLFALFVRRRFFWQCVDQRLVRRDRRRVLFLTIIGCRLKKIVRHFS
jgi:hypothetical protein